MAYRTPVQISAFLDANMHRMDGPYQWIGDEPNSYRKDWDSTSVRACIMACWAYEQAAGNQAIPLVYKTINDAGESFLCDRTYFFATPRDLKLFERHGIPQIGIESRHQLMDFDVVGTSISYPVLTINFVKQLMMSDIPPTWRERHENPEKWPMVIVGGQNYGAPEATANVVDAVFAGEVEDESGNPGLGAVFRRIDTFKKYDLWQTKRRWCYEQLAREFNFLYFPCFVDVHYGYEERPSVASSVRQWFGEDAEVHPSKQVIGYTSQVPGMRLPIVKRFVKDLDSVEGLTNPPLLFVDPGLGSGDAETSRGCPAWCSFCALCLSGSTSFLTRHGVRTLAETVGESHEVWTSEGWVKAEIDQHGEDRLNTITFAPAFRGWSHYAQRYLWKKTTSSFQVTHQATAMHRWPLADGGETHHLEVGDFTAIEYARDESPDYDEGWVHGLTFGDGTLENSRLGERSNCYAVLVTVDHPEYLERLENLRCGAIRDHTGCNQPVCVLSVTQTTKKLYRIRMNSRVKLKHFPLSTDCSSSYVRGFIEGWDAADGNAKFRGEDRLRINAQHPGAEQWLRENAAYGGWILTGITERKSRETNYGTRKNPAREYQLNRVGAWKVISIEEGTVPEPVYCATVPGVGFWTLATGVYTGNTYRQKPYRQRSPEYMVNFSQKLLENTGALHISPFGPDFPMHTQKKRLIRDILEKVTDDVDASSMRVDDFIADPSYILLQAHGGMDTVTLGVEGNSQRMRDFVGKGASDASIKEAFAKGIQAGLRKFKFYMIASLPGEDNGDVYRILALGKDLADIRDTMGATTRIQFSWTPMLIEGNTPFQWFAPTSNNYALGDVWEELRALKIDFKLGGKSAEDKVAFYQLTQRASRDVGAALVETARQFNVGCWGGVPKGLKAALDENLRKYGFLNGFADCYDERIKEDMFGWEFIDQGINHELLWQTYQQMVEFLESTDSETYDEYFHSDYQGNEWIQRCDSACLGKTCGVCGKEDLKLRRNYIQGAANEVDIDLTRVKVIDQRSVVMKVRLRVVKSADHRFVPNVHYRYALRRAANRVGLPHTKRTWRIASDSIQFRDFTCGADYVEFGLTERRSREQLEPLITAMGHELEGLVISAFDTLPAEADGLRQDMDLSLFEMEMDVSASQTQRAIEDWHNSEYVPMIFHKPGQLGMVRDEVNGKDYVDALWLVKEGHRLKIKMLIRGKASPYIVYAALFHRPSWIEAAQYPAIRVESFVEHDATVVDSFRPLCLECGKAIPVTLLDTPFHPDYCPQCLDLTEGIVLGAAHPVGSSS